MALTNTLVTATRGHLAEPAVVTDRAIQGLGVAVASSFNVSAAVAATQVSVAVQPASIIASG